MSRGTEAAPFRERSSHYRWYHRSAQMLDRDGNLRPDVIERAEEEMQVQDKDNPEQWLRRIFQYHPRHKFLFDDLQADLKARFSSPRPR